MSLRCCCILSLTLLFLATAALALETPCVDSAAELRAAMWMAKDDPVEIHVVQGAYDLHASPLSNLDFDPDYSISIIGGYAPDCSSRSLDPRDTLLYSSSVGGSTIGTIEEIDLRFESLTMRNLTGRFFTDSDLPSAYELRMSRVRLEHSKFVVHTERVILSQVYAFSTTAIDQGCVFEMTDPETVRITHSVFAGISGDAICIDGDDGIWEVFATNNIFWNNTGFDLFVHSPDEDNEVHLFNNIVQSTALLPAPTQAPIGSLNQDPLFFDEAGHDYRLQVGSPAINSGYVGTLGVTQDIDGGPRWVGSRPDRGIHESNVDDTNGLSVTTTADQIAPLISGSLRWAILQSNNDPDTNTISFNIPGGCPRIIELVAPLPSITDRVIIDGYSQPGSEPATSSYNFNATICVGIKGNLSTNHALEVPISVGSSQSLNVSGIGFGGFDVGAIRIAGGAGSWIHGNQFGGELEGVALGNSAVNVRIGGTSYQNLVGGEEPAQRNLIMFAWNAGIELLENSGGAEGHSNHVINNFIGTNASGNAMAANNIGIRVRTHENVIDNNVISGNQTHGVLIEGDLANNNTVSSNKIGLKSFAICLPEPCDPDYALGNIQFGVLVEGGGDDNRIQFNEVAHNGSKGIRLFDGLRNRLLGNSVHDNASLGIDLGVSGVNPDYPASGSDQLANNGINTPHLAGVHEEQGQGRLSGSVSTHSGSYVMQAFKNDSCDASGHGEGQTLIGTQIIDIPGPPGSGGLVHWEMQIEQPSAMQGKAVSVTWFDAEGNSSEFSNCVTYQCDLIFAHGFESDLARTCGSP